MALALPGQCVTEAITIKKTYLPKLILTYSLERNDHMVEELPEQSGK